jgi:replication fork clamp-binding protein CrfC
LRARISKPRLQHKTQQQRKVKLSKEKDLSILSVIRTRSKRLQSMMQPVRRPSLNLKKNPKLLLQRKACLLISRSKQTRFRRSSDRILPKSLSLTLKVQYSWNKRPHRISILREALREGTLRTTLAYSWLTNKTKIKVVPRATKMWARSLSKSKKRRAPLHPLTKVVKISIRKGCRVVLAILL